MQSSTHATTRILTSKKLGVGSWRQRAGSPAAGDAWDGDGELGEVVGHVEPAHHLEQLRLLPARLDLLGAGLGLGLRLGLRLRLRDRVSAGVRLRLRLRLRLRVGAATSVVARRSPPSSATAVSPRVPWKTTPSTPPALSLSTSACSGFGLGIETQP